MELKSLAKIVALVTLFANGMAAGAPPLVPHPPENPAAALAQELLEKGLQSVGQIGISSMGLGFNGGGATAPIWSELIVRATVPFQKDISVKVVNLGSNSQDSQLIPTLNIKLKGLVAKLDFKRDDVKSDIDHLLISFRNLVRAPNGTLGITSEGAIHFSLENQVGSILESDLQKIDIQIKDLRNPSAGGKISFVGSCLLSQKTLSLISDSFKNEQALCNFTYNYIPNGDSTYSFNLRSRDLLTAEQVKEVTRLMSLPDPAVVISKP